MNLGLLHWRQGFFERQWKPIRIAYIVLECCNSTDLIYQILSSKLINILHCYNYFCLRPQILNYGRCRPFWWLSQKTDQEPRKLEKGQDDRGPPLWIIWLSIHQLLFSYLEWTLFSCLFACTSRKHIENAWRKKTETIKAGINTGSGYRVCEGTGNSLWVWVWLKSEVG